MGLEIIAIEDSDAVGWVEAATSIGEVTFRSVASMVDNIVAYAGSRRIKLLHLQAHGNSAGFYVGPDSVTLGTLATTWRGPLARLTPLFDSDPWVDLRACEVGQNVALVANLAGIWGTTIVAGRGLQNNLFDLNFGRYVTVKPDGSSETSLLAPPQVAYNVSRRLFRQITS